MRISDWIADVCSSDLAVVPYRAIDHTRNDHLVGGTHKQRIAVGCGARHSVGADSAPCSAQVFDHYALPQTLGQGFTQSPRREVHAAACWVAYDDADWLRRVTGRLRRCCLKDE